MPIKLTKFTTKDKELYKQASKIRISVFVDEQKVSKEEEFDGLDDISTQYIVFFNEKPAGTGRLRETNDGYKLERFAVVKEFRGENIGKEILQAMLNDILPTNKNIYLYSQLSAQKFYEKQDFIPEGNVFVEAGIDHIKMIYKT